MFPNLKRLVQPRNIVIIGASDRDGSHGKNTFHNLSELSDFPDENIYLVNPNYQQLMGKKCYPSVSEIECGTIDVALILVNAALVPKATEECAKKNIPFAIIMSSGFSEIGNEGSKAQEELEAVIERTGIRVYGPNCPGLTDINRRLGMTFSPAFSYDTLGGGIGVVTQGGGLGRTALQGQKRGIGFGYFFSPGNEIDLELSDFIYYMLNDPNIKVIAAVSEGLKNGEKFKEVAKLALQKKKPIVILKVGRSELGRKAALSHTGSLAGSDEIFDALCKQFGVIRVNDIDELLETSTLFTRGKIIEDPGIAIVTASGGSGSLAADYCGMEGISLAELSDSTLDKLKNTLPAFISISNPVDLTASILVDKELHEKCVRPILEDEAVDILIEPINASYGKATESLAVSLGNLQKETDKMIIPIWMSSMEDGGYHHLEKAGLIPFRSIRNAITALKHYTRYGECVKELSSSNTGMPEFSPPLTKQTAEATLNEYEGKKLIREIGINTPRESLAKTLKEAILISKHIGYPVALKIVSDDIPHKTEVGGIKLNLADEEELTMAYGEIVANVHEHCPEAAIEGFLVSEMVTGGIEMILGLKKDPQYGTAILVGMGGVQAEIINDTAIGICPIPKKYAKQLINQLAGSPLLYGYRGSPKMDVDALAAAIENLSLLGAEGKIKEADINPLIVKAEGKGVVALDALIALHAASMAYVAGGN